MSLGPPRGPLLRTWRRLPAEVPAAKDPGASDSSSEDLGDAVARNGVSLRVSSSGSPGSTVPLPLSSPPRPLPTTSVPGSRLSPLHLENTLETARAPTRADAAPRAPRGCAGLGALTHRSWRHAGVSAASRMRGSEETTGGGGWCPEHWPPSRLTSPRPPLPPPLPPLPPSGLCLCKVSKLSGIVELRRRRLEPGQRGGGVRLGAASGTPSPGCNGRGARAAGEGPRPWPAGAGSGARRSGAGAGAARGPPLPPPSARPLGPLPPTPPPAPPPPSLGSAFGSLGAACELRSHVGRGRRGGGRAGETPAAARGADGRPGRALRGPLRAEAAARRLEGLGKNRSETRGVNPGEEGGGRPPSGRGGAPRSPVEKKGSTPSWRRGRALDFL